jgi:hypothetical protein
MAEWLKALAWKAGKCQKCFGGSNPPLSAPKNKNALKRAFLFAIKRAEIMKFQPSVLVSDLFTILLE